MAAARRLPVATQVVACVAAQAAHMERPRMRPDCLQARAAGRGAARPAHPLYGALLASVVSHAIPLHTTGKSGRHKLPPRSSGGCAARPCGRGALIVGSLRPGHG